MHDIDIVKKRIITSMIAILLLVFALFGITYAYFTAKVKGNTNDKSVDVSAGKLELTYGDGNGFIKVDKIQPGEVIKSKTFTVKNTGTGDIESYEVILENIINELKYYNDLTYELECKSDIGTCAGSNDVFPIYDNSIITNSIKVGETHTYTLTLTYHETNLDQSDDMDKTIEARVNIRDSEFNYTKLNIYTTTEQLGTLVNDDANRFNKKYKIDIKSVGKNLFDISKIPRQDIVNGNSIILSGYVCNSNLTPEMFLKMTGLKVGDVITTSYVVISEKGSTGGATGQIRFNKHENSSSTFMLGKPNMNRTNEVVEELNSDIYGNLLFYGNVTDDNNESRYIFSNIQIEKGTQATSYEPYEEKIYSVYVNEPLRCLDSTCDYIDLVNKKVIRKIKDDNGTLSILDNSIEEKIQSVDSDVLTNRNIIVDGANVEQELDR